MLGGYLTHIGWFDDRSSELLVNLVVKISMPMLLMYNLILNYTRSELIQAASALLVPVLSLLLCHFFSILACKLINVDKSRIGAFRTMFLCSNTLFMGLPINLALFGEESIPYVFMYYVVNTTFFWTLGAYEMAKDGDSINGKLFSLESIKKVLSPPLIGMAVAVFLILLGLNPPGFLMDTFKYLANMTTPLSMLFIGISIYQTGLTNIKLNRDMAMIFLGRFILSPMSILLFSFIFPIDRLMRDVFVIQSAMPVITSAAMVAKSYNADYSYVSIMVTVTTLACVIIIPLLKVILAYI